MDFIVPFLMIPHHQKLQRFIFAEKSIFQCTNANIFCYNISSSLSKVNISSQSLLNLNQIIDPVRDFLAPLA